MESTVLNQDTPYGRALFSIEEDCLCVTTGKGGSRRKVQCRLVELDPKFERQTKRFVVTALGGLAFVIGIAIVFWKLVHLLPGGAELSEQPFARACAYILGALFVGSAVVHSVFCFRRVETVVCRSKDGRFAIQLFLTGKHNALVEDLLRKLLEAIEEKVAKTEPHQRLENNAGMPPPSFEKSTAIEARLPGVSQP